MQQELQDKELAINQRAIDKQKVKEKYNNMMQAETDKMNKELETKLRQLREIFQNQIEEKDEKLKLMKQILENGNGTDTSITAVSKEYTPSTSNSGEKSEKQKKVIIQSTIPETPLSPTTATKTATKVEFEEPDNLQASKKNLLERIPVVNPRYRRSRSADRWIDHRPTGLVPVGTIFQPLMHRKRSVTQLTDPKDFTDRASRYCLVAQEQDTDGELETKLYKADILPTSGGGAQVVFNDLEQLKQVSPTGRRKRSGNLNPEYKDPVSTNSCSILEANHSKKARV